MKRFISSIAVLFLAVFVFAVDAERSVKISSKNKSDNDYLKVYEVERKKEVTGNYSSTTIEYIIENRSNKIIEGEFESSLKEGESISGYALDINGKMRPGVAVEKDKGRQVFEDVVRKNVDPGLIEMTAGNNFKTRVYPIPANGVRHISITIEKELSSKDASEKIFTQTEGKDTYFYFYTKIADSKSVEGMVKPKKVTVLFDVSDSAKNRDIDKEIEFIKKYSEVTGNPAIDFVTFADDIIDSFGIEFGKNSKEAVEKIKSLKFDGASNLGVIKKVSGDSDIILFTDGLENWGNEDSSKILTDKKIFTVNSSKSANYSMLKKIAENNNGIFINLCNTKTDVAAKKIQENPLRILSVEFNDSEINSVYPGRGEIINNGFSVAGILKKKSGKIKISIGRNGKVESVIQKTISAVESGDVCESDKVARLWAMKKIADLDSAYDDNRSQIIDLAKEFTIVTKDTSLIVLDSVHDYVRYGIVPPDDLKKEYERLVSIGRNSKSSDNGIPGEVYSGFEEFKKWWNKSPKDFEKEIQPPHKSSVRASEALYSNSLSEAAPMVESRMVGTYYMDSEADYEECEVRESVAVERADNMANSSRPESADVTVSLQAWNSKSDYISILKKTSADKMYAKYLELKINYGRSPAFFMEVSDYFVEEGLVKEGKRILSNLAELNLENTDVLRALGYKLVDQKDFGSAVRVFEKLIKLRPEVPQFSRDLAMALNENGEYQKAVDALWYVASKKWDSRYADIQQTCLNDMNSIIARNKNIDTSAIDKKLMSNFDMDLRIVLTWNTDDCDIDLWVTDPKSEKCYYGHKITKQGGRMSRDFTQGYGPEEFCIKVAPKGNYKIECNYYGNHQQKLLQPVIVQAEVYTNFGRKNQTKQVMTLQLDDIKQTFHIGDIKVK